MARCFIKSLPLLGVLLVGLVLGVLLNNPIRDAFLGEKPEEEQFKLSHQKGYLFINPLLDFEQKYREVPKINKDMEKYISEAKKEGHLKDISVYFRHLNTGSTFSINGGLKFSPASLLKVPLMIACLRQAELDPGFLGYKINYEFPVEGNTIPNFRYGEPIVLGESYTVEDLLVRLIINSDNDAGTLLLQNVDGRILERVYTDLEIAMPWFPGMENYMTVADYSKFMRILYNSTYLSRDMSEFALYIMSKSHFEQGILAGVGPNTTVSHKFGERDIEGMKQLHDCGIIFYDSGPCLLCVMTRGGDFVQLEQVIADITKIVSSEMNGGS